MEGGEGRVDSGGSKKVRGCGSGGSVVYVSKVGGWVDIIGGGYLPRVGRYNRGGEAICLEWVDIIEGGGLSA